MNILSLSEKIRDFASKQDFLLNKKAGYDANDLRANLHLLTSQGRVEVGWRETCSSTDRTAHIHRAWQKVISKIEKEGISVHREPVKHKNAYASNNGGFWQSIIYSV